MSLLKPTIVIFDMDGTSVRHLNPLILALCERYDDIAYKISKFFGWLFHRGAQGPILPANDPLKPFKPKRLLVHRAIHKLRRKKVEQMVEPCPGLYAVLDLLMAHDIPLALVSNGLGKGYGLDIVERFGLNKYFAAAVFREDIRKSKPNPECLLTALGRLGIKPGRDDVIWFIGDRHKDITAALAADAMVEARVIPVAYALNAAVAVLEKGVGPENIIMGYPDMYVRLEKLLGKPPGKFEDTGSVKATRQTEDGEKRYSTFSGS